MGLRMCVVWIASVFLRLLKSPTLVVDFSIGCPWKSNKNTKDSEKFIFLYFSFIEKPWYKLLVSKMQCPSLKEYSKNILDTRCKHYDWCVTLLCIIVMAIHIDMKYFYISYKWICTYIGKFNFLMYNQVFWDNWLKDLFAKL